MRPELPAALGAEGVGRIIAVGEGVDAARVGERVLVVPTLEQATWREQTVLDQRNAVPVDADGDPRQLAMLCINPLTAYCLLHGYVNLAPAAWVAQTSSGLTVGTERAQEVISTLTGASTAATVLFVSATVDAFLDEYIRRYTAGDVRGVTNLCHVPFLAVRRGEAIHMPDSGAVWDHFAAAIGAYRRAAGVETWNRLETDTRQLGEQSVFASVHWNALDANEKVVRDTWTSYQLLGTAEGWQLLSYTNHF